MSIARKASAGLAWGQMGRVAEIGLALVFSVVVVRQLGEQGYGTYALIFGLIGVATLLSSLGLNEALAKYVPVAGEDDPDRATGLLQSFLLWRLLLTLSGCGVFYAIAGLLGGIFGNPAIARHALLIVAVFALQNTVDLLGSFYVSALRVASYYLIRLVGQTLALLLTLGLFAVRGRTVENVLLALVLSSAAAAVLYGLGARGKLGRVRRPAGMRGIYRFAATIWLINLLTFGLASQVDTLLIGYFLRDEAQIAYYNVATMVLARLYLVLTGWSVVVLPSLAATFGQRGREGFTAASETYFRLHFAVLFPVFAFVALQAQGLVGLVFGGPFAPSVQLLTVGALMNLAATCVFSGPVLNVLYVAGAEKTVLWLRVVFGLANVILDVVLIPFLGALGAVLATGSCILFEAIGEWIVVRARTRVAYPTRFAAKVALATALAAAVTVWLRGGGWPLLLASAVVYGVVWAAALYVLKPLSVRERDLARLANRYAGLIADRF